MADVNESKTSYERFLNEIHSHADFSKECREIIARDETNFSMETALDLMGVSLKYREGLLNGSIVPDEFDITDAQLPTFQAMWEFEREQIEDTIRYHEFNPLSLAELRAAIASTDVPESEDVRTFVDTIAHELTEKIKGK